MSEARGLLSLGRVVERPPEQYRQGPSTSGRTLERLFDDPRALQAFCAENGALPAAKRQGDAYAMACWVPDMGGGQDVIAIPSAKGWPSGREREQLKEHEWGHARGWRHEPAKGLLSLGQVVQRPDGSYDWSRAFTAPTAPR